MKLTPAEKDIPIMLTGVLDSRKFKEMDDTACKEFLVNDANDILPQLIKPLMFTDLETDAAHEYTVKAKYLLMDSYYHMHGTVEASLVWSRGKGARLTEYKTAVEG